MAGTALYLASSAGCYTNGQEIVIDGRNGVHFTAGDARDLASKVEWAWARPAVLDAMGHAGRDDFERLYSAETNYKRLLQIYEKTVARASAN